MPYVLSRSLPCPVDATTTDAVCRRAVTVIRLCQLRHLKFDKRKRGKMT
jgi:hypothetical protein